MQHRNNSVMMLPPGRQLAYHVNSRPRTTIYPKFQSKINLGLGITQVTVGTICVLFQITSIIMNASLSFVSLGIWGGIVFVIAGIFGILASRSKSRCTVITLLVMSVISAVLAGGMFINQSFAFSIAFHYHHNYYNPDCAINVMLLLSAFAEMAAATLQAVSCCYGTNSNPHHLAPAAQGNHRTQSNEVFNQGPPQGQPQHGPGPHHYVVSQGQFIPAATSPQGSSAPMARPPDPMAGPSVPAAVSQVSQTQVQAHSYPHTAPTTNMSDPHALQMATGQATTLPAHMQISTGRASPLPGHMQMTTGRASPLPDHMQITSQISPPREYIDNPDRGQFRTNVEDSGRTNPGQIQHNGDHWEKF